MPPASSEAAGSSTSRTSSKAIILEVTTPYQHSQPLYEHFFVENKNTFLSALGAPTTCPETSRSGHSPARERTQRSRFEGLPYEILMLVLEHLDIASLVTIASVNTHVRGLVQGLADVKKIQHNIYTARAVSRVYTIRYGTVFKLERLHGSVHFLDLR
jgi:F-box domain